MHYDSTGKIVTEGDRVRFRGVDIKQVDEVLPWIAALSGL